MEIVVLNPDAFALYRGNVGIVTEKYTIRYSETKETKVILSELREINNDLLVSELKSNTELRELAEELELIEVNYHGNEEISYFVIW